MTPARTIHPTWSEGSCDRAIAAINGARDLNILVVGDIMVDAYLMGRVDRISPEAPVPILSASRRERRPGGAANVALNLKSLGCAVAVAGIIGKDQDGRDLREALEELDMDTGGIFEMEDRRTTVKTRIMSGGQHLLRVDEEDDVDLDAEASQLFVEHLAKLLSAAAFDAILIEDYDKGTLSPVVIRGLLHLAGEHGIMVSVDPKFRHFDLYEGVTLFKPNLKELREGLGLVWDDQDSAAMDKALTSGLDLLMDRMQPEHILLTLSERGVRIRSAMEDVHQAAHPREILDVSGAGDTVIAVATTLLAQGVDAVTMAQVANLAGGLVCEKSGVVPVDPDSLIAEMRRLPIQA